MPTIHGASSHGVLMRVDGSGVLLTGRAGSGKSSLALALLARGHALVADDAPELCADGDIVHGRCPPLLQDLLHSRSLGVINIRRLHGGAAICETTTVDLIVELCSAVAATAGLDGQWHEQTVCGVKIPALKLAPNHHMEPATHVETAVRVLQRGARADDTLRSRQAQAMEASGCN